MENCRLKVVESDEALKFEMAVNACLRDLERAGCAYEVSASIDGYFYKAVIKHAAPANSSAEFDDSDELMERVINARLRCCHCVYYDRDRGSCFALNKSVKFAGTVCDHFRSGRLKA